MAIKLNVTQKLDNNHVQIEVEHPKVPTRYFKVPENKADEFCKAYKQFNTDQSVWSAIRVATPSILLCGIANYLTKNKSKTTQWITGIATGLVSVYTALNLNTKLLINKEDSLLKKHNAEELNFEVKSLPFLNKTK